MRVNRWLYLWIVQSYWGGWEDVTAADTLKEARGYLRDYRVNEPHITHRLIKRREPNPEYKEG